MAERKKSRKIRDEMQYIGLVKDDYWATFDKRIFDDDRLSRDAKFVYIYLMSCSSEGVGATLCGNANELAEQTCESIEAFHIALGNLVECGYLIIEEDYATQMDVYFLKDIVGS